MKDSAAGCLVLFLIGIGLAIALVWGIGYAQQGAANVERARGEAESMIIRAQAQARLDAATTSAVFSAAMLPWGVLSIVGLLGIGVLALAFVVIYRRPQTATVPPQIIERQIIYLPPPGQPRRDTWQALSAGNAIEVIPANRALVRVNEEIV